MRVGNLQDFPEIQLASKHIETIRDIVFNTILVNEKEVMIDPEASEKVAKALLPKFLIQPYVLEFFHPLNGLLRQVTLACQKQGNLFIDDLNKTDADEFDRYVCVLNLICGLHDIYSDVSKTMCDCLKMKDLLKYQVLSLAIRLFCMRTQDSIMNILTKQILEDPSHEDSLKANTH